MEYDVPKAEGLLLYHISLPKPSGLLEEAVQKGWQGNLYHCSLAYQLLTDENVFTLSCERRDIKKDSLYALALQDLEQIRQLYQAEKDHSPLSCFTHSSDAAKTDSAKAVTELSVALEKTKTAEEMLILLTGRYTANGVGMFGLNRLFRARRDDRGALLRPVENPLPASLSDLVGYESQKKRLKDNTLSFLRGERANNVLLYGDAGTGKSSSIQAIACEYAHMGLRLIELHRSQADLIPEIYDILRHRNYRFILFLDDLSFEENEVDYKQLKAAIEGGAEAVPENVLIYATSNRRHLIRETWNDRKDMEHQGDIHRSDTMEEKLSLSARFGLQIYYPNPSFEEYHTIVQKLASKNPGLSAYTEEQLRALASTWQVQRGNRSGRTAKQFINSLQVK